MAQADSGCDIQDRFKAALSASKSYSSCWFGRAQIENKILLTSTIMVSVAREKWVYFVFPQWIYSLNCLFSMVTEVRFILPNLIPQSVIKKDMKMELRMEGAVNGHKFVITGEGRGQPFEWVKVYCLISVVASFKAGYIRTLLQLVLTESLF